MSDDKDMARPAEQALVSDQAPAGLAASRFAPSRRALAFDAILQAGRIQALANKAKEAKLAEQWLSDYGYGLFGEGDNYHFTFRAEFAGSCVGAGEANAYIWAAVKRLMPEIIASARAEAVRDLEALIAIAIDARSDATKCVPQGESAGLNEASPNLGSQGSQQG